MNTTSETTQPKTLKRKIKLFLLSSFALFVVVSLVLLALAWDAMGHAPSEAQYERMKASPQWLVEEEIFGNPQPLYTDPVGTFTTFKDASSHGSPEEALPVLEVDPVQVATPPESGLRITWLGHSTTLIDVDGKRFLTDPIFGPRASPLTFIGPKRWYEPLIALEELPSLDAILISHDHYDHLDHVTMKQLVGREDLEFIVPLGVGAHLIGWGISPAQIKELDWWDEVMFGEVKVTMTPARHASGRQIFDQNRTLWAGYALNGPKHAVYFSGDTGLAPSFGEVGEKLGPFDVTMVEVGAYNKAWPDWHSGPEHAVRIHKLLRGKVFLPIHWGLFNLATHGWTEPVERTLLAAERSGVKAIVPKPGEMIEPDVKLPNERWWPDVPFLTEEEDRLPTTGVDELLK